MFRKKINIQHLLFKNVAVKIRYRGFETHTRNVTLPRFTSRLEDLKKVAMDLVLPFLLSSRK